MDSDPRSERSTMLQRGAQESDPVGVDAAARLRAGPRWTRETGQKPDQFPMDESRLSDLGRRKLDSSIKALPLRPDETLLAQDVGMRQWNVRRGDMDFPVLVLKERELIQNIGLMAAYCRQHLVSLAPHGKTTMAPQIFQRQIAAGAWGITAATISQCRTFRAFGVRRILLANVLVDPVGIKWIMDELEGSSDFEFVCYVDSVRGIELIEKAIQGRPRGVRLPVLIELGYAKGRTGCRSREEARQIAKRVRRSQTLELSGVAGFEGLVPAGTVERPLRPIDEYLREMQQLVVALHDDGGGAPGRAMIVTAGGSAYFDRVVKFLGPEAFDFPVQTILRSGCYVTHDAELYEATSPLAGRGPSDGPRLQPALELWATVWSRPEPDLAILGLGTRDTPYDYRLPVPQSVWRPDQRRGRDVRGRYHITGLNDQHAFVRIPPDDPLRVGDQVVCGVSHPCGAFDKWSFIPVVDDEYSVIGGISTLF